VIIKANMREGLANFKLQLRRKYKNPKKMLPRRTKHHEHLSYKETIALLNEERKFENKVFPR